MELQTMLIVEESTTLSENVNYSNRLQKLYQSKNAQLHKLKSDRKSLRFLVLQAEADAICRELEQFFRK